MEELTGTLEIESGHVADFELSAGGSTHTRSERATCSLRLLDGRVVATDVTKARLKGWTAEVVRKGAWAEVEAHPAAGLFADVAPGPHVRSALKRVGPKSGDRVVLVGTVKRGAPTATEAPYRGKLPKPVPVQIDVTTIRNPAGKEVAKRKQPKRKAEPECPRPEHDWWDKGWLITTGIMLLAGILGVVQAVLLPKSTAALVAGWGYAAGLGFMAACAALNLRALPNFIANGKPEDVRSNVTVAWALVAVLPFVAAATGLSESIPLLTSGNAEAVSLTKRGTVAGLRVDMLRGYVVFLHLATAVLAVVQWVVTRKAAQRARMLVGKLSPSGALTAGAWVLVEGTVVTDRAYVRRCVHTFLGKNQGSSASCDEHAFTLRGPSGDVTVGKGGIWATSEVRRRKRSVAYSIPNGSSAVLAGRIDLTEGGPAMTGKGEESLFLYATADSAPVNDIRSRLRLRSLALVVAAGCVAAAAAVWRLPGSGWLSREALWRRIDELDGVAEPADAAYVAGRGLGAIGAVDMVGAEVAVIDLVAQHGVGDRAHRSRDGGDGLVGSASRPEPKELGTQVALLDTNRGPSSLHERCLEPGRDLLQSR